MFRYFFVIALIVSQCIVCTDLTLVITEPISARTGISLREPLMPAVLLDRTQESDIEVDSDEDADLILRFMSEPIADLRNERYKAFSCIGGAIVLGFIFILWNHFRQ